MPTRKQQLGFSRREALRVLGCAGALPFVQPGWARSAPGELSRGAWRPRFLDPSDVETVANLSACIMSEAEAEGSRHPAIHEYIDVALSEAEPAVQASFNQGLSWLDHYAARSTGHCFVELDRTDQLALLAEISDTSRSHEPTGFAFLTLIKQLTIEGHYRPESARLG